MIENWQLWTVVKFFFHICPFFISGSMIVRDLIKFGARSTPTDIPAVIVCHGGALLRHKLQKSWTRDQVRWSTYVISGCCNVMYYLITQVWITVLIAARAGVAAAVANCTHYALCEDSSCARYYFIITSSYTSSGSMLSAYPPQHPAALRLSTARISRFVFPWSSFQSSSFKFEDDNSFCKW